MSITSCKKGDAGAQGPQGEQGITGAQGVAGPVGPAGKDGSIMYAGSTVPAATVGKAGDYYLNRSSGQLYGPKTATGWGNAIGLKGANGATGAKGDKGDKGTSGAKGDKGATGAAGKDGSKTLSGAGAPASNLGAMGDFYLDKTNYLLYGPKAATWGLHLS